MRAMVQESALRYVRIADNGGPNRNDDGDDDDDDDDDDGGWTNDADNLTG